MSKSKRNRYSADFKAKVALEAIRGELTVAELAKKHAIHPNLITNWKRQATEGMRGVFERRSESAGEAQQSEVERLHAKIGQLIVERDPRSSRGQAFCPRPSVAERDAAEGDG